MGNGKAVPHGLIPYTRAIIPHPITPHFENQIQDTIFPPRHTSPLPNRERMGGDTARSTTPRSLTHTTKSVLYKHHRESPYP